MAEEAKSEANKDAGAASAGGWLTRSVLGMGLASLFADWGYEMAIAALPGFLVAIGGGPAALGLIEGAADGISSFVKLFAGALADRKELRKPVAVAGYTLTGVATGAFALAGVWWHVLLARTLGWIAKGGRGPARDAMLSDAVRPEVRGRAFGFHRMMDTIGAVLGPLTALAILSRALPVEVSYVGAIGAVPPGGLPIAGGLEKGRLIFEVSLLPGLLAGLAFFLLVKAQAGEKRVRQPRFGERLRLLPSGFRQYLGAAFLFGLGDFSHALLILRTSEVLGPALGARDAMAFGIGLYAAHNVVSASVSYPIGVLADRLGKRPLLVLAFALSGAIAAGFAFAPASVVVTSVLFLSAGIVHATVDSLEGAIAADLTPGDLRGTAFGVLSAVNGVGDLASSAALGALWAAGGATTGFAFSAGLCGLGAVLLALGGRPRADEPVPAAA